MKLRSQPEKCGTLVQQWGAVKKQKVKQLVGKENQSRNVKVFKVSTKVARLGAKRVVKDKVLPETPQKEQKIGTLSTSFHPCEVVGREKELEQIRSFIQGCVDSQSGSSLYICGAPGTGKSLSLATIAKELQSSADFKSVVQLNGMSFSSPASFFPDLLEAFNAPAQFRKSRSTAERSFRSFITCRRKLSVLILDEMDGFLDSSSSQNVLYSLFELSRHCKSSLVLIGIANTLDLTERFLPRLEINNHSPEFLVFGSYTIEQLGQILKNRSSDECTLDESAIKLASMKIAASSGDARKLLELARRSVENSQSCAGEEKLIVGMKDVSQACSSLLASPIMEMISKLPRHQQIVLCILSVFLCKKKTQQIASLEFQQFYYRTTKSKGLPEVNTCQLAEIISSLSSSSIITLKKNSNPTKRKLSLNVDHADIECALRDIPIIQNILSTQ